MEMLAELSLTQIQAVLHSARKAKVTGKGLILKTQQTAQYVSDSSQAKGIQLNSQSGKRHSTKQSTSQSTPMCFKDAN